MDNTETQIKLKYLLPLRTPCIYYDPHFLPPSTANDYYHELLQDTPWETSPKINRWVALMEDSSTGYRYRDAPGQTLGFSPTIHKLRLLAIQWYTSLHPNPIHVELSFNVCLLNYYESGSQRIGWHSDREEMGRSTPIVSISLGAPRSFLVRSKTDGVHDRISLVMENGSLILMENVCQERYLHSVPREEGVEEGRINVTFRCKDGGATTEGERLHEQRDGWIDRISTEGGSKDSAAAGWMVDTQTDAPLDGRVFGDGVRFDFDCGVDESSVVYVIKTNIGAECYCAAELEEVMEEEPCRILARPFGIAGYVAVCRLEEEDRSEEIGFVTAWETILLSLRAAHHILRYHDHFDLKQVLSSLESEEGSENVKDEASIDGEMLYSYYKNRLVSGLGRVHSLENLESGTFRVTCDRTGKHGFQAPGVEREMGGALSEYYHRIKPKMNDFDFNIRIDFVANQCIIGTQLNIDDISKDRHFLRFRNGVTIKTNLAYAMIRCANIKPGSLVCDPFCGSGTILLETLDVYRNQNVRCIGMDVSRRAANGAKENALAEGFSEDQCQFHCCDARNFRRHLSESSVDAIISNMPWGVMTGHKNVSDLQSMYEVFLRTAWYILKDEGRIVMLVLRGLQLTRIIRKLSGRYRLLNVNVVRTTNNLPSIVVVEKLAHDDVRDSVKRQLAFLAQFVNVSSEMYSAVHYEKIDETTL